MRSGMISSARASRCTTASFPSVRKTLRRRSRSLGQAGHLSTLTVTLNTSSVAPGMLESATAFAAQATAAGVTVKLNNIPAADFYGSGYLKYGFGQSQWNADTLPQWMEQAVVKGAPYNETHWNVPSFNRRSPKRERSSTRRSGQMLFDDLQKHPLESGRATSYGASSPSSTRLEENVRGATPNPAQDLSNYMFREYWLA